MYSTTGIDASNFVSTYNTAFYFIAGISLFLLVGLTTTMLIFIYRYNRKKNKVPSQIEGNTFLEVTWTVVPVILGLAMFHFGWKGWLPTTKPPGDAMIITSVAKMWSFSFLYDNGKQSPDLIVPVKTPVIIKLVSLDVIHSLFIPEFRIKSDIIPGREKTMWFIPEVEGEYDLLCAEYCGLRHSYMKAKVKVLSNEKFNAFYSGTSPATKEAEVSNPASEGFAILRDQGCIVCHSSDGSKIVGPTYLHLYGRKEVVVRDGVESTITVDDAFIKRAIYDPGYYAVKGYPKGLMQSYKDKLTDADIAKIIAYLKSLNEK